MNLDGATYSAAVDSIGQWHNDFLAYLLNEMQARNIQLSTDTIQSFLKSSMHVYFATKGITPQNTSLPDFDLSDTTWQISSFSAQAQSIFNQLKSLVDTYSETNHSYFINQCTGLKTDALNLQNNQEALSVGAAISVAINSFTYWKDNVVYWQNYLTPSNPVAKSEPCTINLKKLGGADIKGAIAGAGGGGLVGGPGGALAGGILGAAGNSSFNILGQALDCMPGVVGSVSRWYHDWF